MTLFRCPVCGKVDEQPFARQEWHTCQGRRRELKAVPPEMPAPEPVEPLRLF